MLTSQNGGLHSRLAERAPPVSPAPEASPEASPEAEAGSSATVRKRKPEASPKPSPLRGRGFRSVARPNYEEKADELEEAEEVAEEEGSEPPRVGDRVLAVFAVDGYRCTPTSTAHAA